MVKRQSLLMCLAAVAALAPIRLAAQAGSTAEADPLPIPIAIDGPAFEKVSMWRSEPGERSRLEFDPAAGRFIAQNQTLRTLIAHAYAPVPSPPPAPGAWPPELPDARLTGGPPWMAADRFTITAVTGRPVTAVALQRMMRRMLVDRFQLSVRLQIHEEPAYRLSRVPGGGPLGPRLRPAPAPCTPDVGDGGPGHAEWRCVTMPMLAASVHLTEVLGRKVVDGTGLTGAFDVLLIYMPTDEELSTIYRLSRSELPEAFRGRPTIFAAVEEQLGLRLEPSRATVDVLAVDSAARPE